LKRAKLYLVVSALCWLTGCGTIITQYVTHLNNTHRNCVSGKDHDSEVRCSTINDSYVYSGTRMMSKTLKDDFECLWGIKHKNDCLGSNLLVPFILLDFPLSITTDTLILPYTLHKDAIDKDSICICHASK